MRRHYWKQYTLYEQDDGFTLENQFGYIADLGEVEEIAHGLLSYAQAHKSEIDLHNLDSDANLSALTGRRVRSCSFSSQRAQHVYLFECGGFYKIGVTADIGQRSSQLDVRPFELKLIAYSIQTIHAREIESRLHEKYSPKRTCGEWFSLSEDEVSEVSEYLRSITLYEDEAAECLEWLRSVGCAGHPVLGE